jgi:hypothetical protein
MSILQQAVRAQKVRRTVHYELRLVLSLFDQSILAALDTSSCAEESQVVA